MITRLTALPYKKQSLARENLRAINCSLVLGRPYNKYPAEI